MKILFTILSTFVAFCLHAQTSTTVVQTVDMHLINVIKIKFTNTNNATGSTVQLNLDNMSELVNGVTSTNQNLTVNSTKPFNVNVKSSAPYFSYAGSNQQNNEMPVEDVLLLRVNQNNTGGNIGSGYSAFTPITPYSQNIINGGDRGKNKTFRVKYKAQPGLGYAAGNYQTSIIYTATQQ